MSTIGDLFGGTATVVETRFAERMRLLGPAMRFALLVARFRAHPHQLAVMPYGHELPDAAVPLPPATLLWDLAERYHPEQTWLAELWMRGERSLEDIERVAPREALAVGLVETVRQAEAATLGPSTVVPAPAPVRPVIAVDAVARPAKHVVLLGRVWGLRSALRMLYWEGGAVDESPR